MKTGLELIEEVKAEFDESQSTTAVQKSFLYPIHTRRAADEVARLLHPIQGVATIDLISGQQEYVAPYRPYRNSNVMVSDGSGNMFGLAVQDVEWANNNIFNWNASPGGVPYVSGIPEYAFDDGKSYWLYPVPNYSVQGGLALWGYYGIDEWWNMADPLPLPDGYDEIVTAGICIRRAREMVGTSPDYATKLPLWRDTFKELKARLYRERIGRSEATRQSIPSVGKKIGAWSGWTLIGVG